MTDPTTATETKTRKSMPWWAMTLLLTNLSLAALVGWAFLRFDSIPRALAYAAGDRLIPDAATKSFGSVDAGIDPIVTFRLTKEARQNNLLHDGPIQPDLKPPDGEMQATYSDERPNLAARPVILSKASMSCSCTVIDEAFPVTILPGKDHTIKVLVRTVAKSGDLATSVSLYLDDPYQPPKILRITGNVRGLPPSSTGARS